MNEAPTWQIDLYEEISEALRPFCWPETSNAIVQLIIDWHDTRNPHYLDQAQILCFETGAPIPEALQVEMAAAAKLRWEGSPAGGTKKIRNEQTLYSALLFMLNLYHAGLSIPDASRKAQTYTGDRIKASTLERRYGERMRPEPENRLRDHWREIIPNHAELWQPVIDCIPDPAE